MKIKNFLYNLAAGAAIGTGMIIPGVSGGTIAVMMNVYDKIIDSVSNLRREFKKSVLFLLPVLLGAALAFAALYFPIKYALKYAPFPTVMLFAGLMAGSFPKLLKEGVGRGFKPIDILSAVLPLALVVGICFIPELGTQNLSQTMPAWGYFALVAVGILGSCALVVPGVSGSMLLLILGYYRPILDSVSCLKDSFGHYFLVLLLFAVGVVIGFFTIAKIMKILLTKFPRGTYWAIISFVVGSIAALFISFDGNFPDRPAFDGIQTGMGVTLCIAGIIAAFALTALSEAKSEKAAKAATDGTQAATDGGQTEKDDGKVE